MTAPLYPTSWYWIVADHNPTTQVWNGATGAYVANNDATYQAWVGDPSAAFVGVSVINVTGAANNGGGLIRLTVGGTGGYATGNVRVVQNVGGTTEANGTWTITVVDGTHIDLQGSAFVNPYTSGGVLGGGTVIDTQANLFALINAYNLTALTNQNFYGNQSIDLSPADVTLTNPIKSQITITDGGHNLIFPKANLFGSMPIGVPIQINLAYAAGTGALVTIKNASGGSIVANADGGQAYRITLTNNSTADGGWLATPVMTLDASTGSLPVGQASGAYATKAVSGDATLDANGALTLSGTFQSMLTAWTAYTPTVTSITGAFTSVSGAGRYKQVGKIVFFTVAVTITTNGTAGTAVNVTLPVNAKTANFTFAGRENNVTGALLIAWLGDVADLRIQKYDGTYLGANGYLLVVSGSYEAA